MHGTAPMHHRKKEQQKKRAKQDSGDAVAWDRLRHRSTSSWSLARVTCATELSLFRLIVPFFFCFFSSSSSSSSFTHTCSCAHTLKTIASLALNPPYADGLHPTSKTFRWVPRPSVPARLIKPGARLHARLRHRWL